MNAQSIKNYQCYVFFLVVVLGHSSVIWAQPIKGDFNGDGFNDLAVGVPGEDVEGISNAGAVNVIYGSRPGLTGAGDQIWHQNQPGVNFGSEEGDSFGTSLASGDFDGDGFRTWRLVFLVRV